MKDKLIYSLRIYSDVITVFPLSIFFQILSAGVCFRISSREFWTEVIILWQYVYIWPQRHTSRICNKNSDYVIMAIRFLIYKKDLIHVLFLTFLVSGKSCVLSLQCVSQTMSKTLWFYGKFQELILTTWNSLLYLRSWLWWQAVTRLIHPYRLGGFHALFWQLNLFATRDFDQTLWEGIFLINVFNTSYKLSFDECN